MTTRAQLDESAMSLAFSFLPYGDIAAVDRQARIEANKKASYELKMANKRNEAPKKAKFGKAEPKPAAKEGDQKKYDSLKNKQPGPESKYAGTKKLYFDDSYMFSAEAEMLGVEKVADPKSGAELTVVILNQTCFYPQGGGQPTDVGTITLSADGSVEFEVDMCREVSGVIFHYGKFTKGSAFAAGSGVGLKIDGDRRMLNMRIHSAGHAIDIAMAACGMSSLVPTKGYHFPKGAYVEYLGQVPLAEREGLAKKLTDHLAILVEKDLPTIVKEIPVSEVPEVYAGTGFPAGISIVRAAAVGGDLLCPCGGTHIKSSKELGVVTITKIKQKGKSTQFRYELS